MKIIVGLGNPGEKYTFTRHNLGFIILDIFRDTQGFSAWRYESKFKAEISDGMMGGEKTILVKPQTFMNLSGESLQKLRDYYKLEFSDFCIIYDDISMNFGKIRTRETGSAGGHNGIKSIIQYFGDTWLRIKVGVGRDEKYEVSDWVLSEFSEEERIALENEVYTNIEEILKKNEGILSKKKYIV